MVKSNSTPEAGPVHIKPENIHPLSSLRGEQLREMSNSLAAQEAVRKPDNKSPALTNPKDISAPTALLKRRHREEIGEIRDALQGAAVRSSLDQNAAIGPLINARDIRPLTRER